MTAPDSNNVLMMMPGQPSLGTPEIVVTRFTAPEKAVFDMAGSFTNLEAASVSLAVLVNGTTEFSAGFSGQSGGTIVATSISSELHVN